MIMILLSRSLKSLVAAILAVFSLFSQSFQCCGPAQPDTPKNVILLIGDGMGFNHIEMAKKLTGVECLAMDSFELRGESMTRSADNEVTDSAAGGTALACGLRVNNGTVAVYPNDIYAEKSYPMNLSELALSLGMSAGVITTDWNCGATPAAFSVHNSYRKNFNDITASQLKSGLNLIWGSVNSEDSAFSEELANEEGFTCIYNKADMDALECGSRSFARFSYEETWKGEPNSGMPSPAQMTAKAIELLDADEDGFFLMVEGAHIDIKSHGNYASDMAKALLAFDDAIAVALDFAEKDGNTLVVVTADHETGAIVYKGDHYAYMSTAHSAANVPLFIYGDPSFIENGQVINNYEIAQKIAAYMGAEEFPICCLSSAKPDLCGKIRDLTA